MSQIENLLSRVRALEVQIIAIMAKRALEETVETPEQAARRSDKRQEDSMRIAHIKADADRRVTAVRKKMAQR